MDDMKLAALQVVNPTPLRQARPNNLKDARPSSRLVVCLSIARPDPVRSSVGAGAVVTTGFALNHCGDKRMCSERKEHVAGFAADVNNKAVRLCLCFASTKRSKPSAQIR